MIARIAAAALPAILACASSGARPETAAESGPIEGIYEYVANLPNQQVRGTFNVVGDTILVDAVSEHCRPVVAPPDPLYIRYVCQGTGTFDQFFLTIDRRNPARLSKWGATFRVQRQRQICVQYATRDGQRVCVQTQMETYEATESRSGNLQVRRLSA